jgi:hypothetical protein
LLLFVDAVLSGKQVVGTLKPLVKLKNEKRIRLVIRPAFATRFGLNSLVKELGPTFAELDVTTALIVENLEPMQTDRKFSELQLRLDEFAVDPKTRDGIVAVCRRIGAELKAIEDEAETPDFQVGLGGFALGLTTILAGKPSKGVLPVLRLSGKINSPAGSVDWIPLIRHKNASGAG